MKCAEYSSICTKKTYLGVAAIPFIGGCASLTVQVTCFGTDADKGVPLNSSTLTFISSVYNEYQILV